MSQETNAAAGGYPGYQCYKDYDRNTYCSSYKVKNHTEGAAWVGECLAAHPGTSCKGKPWIENKQPSGAIVWPG